MCRCAKLNVVHSQCSEAESVRLGWVGGMGLDKTNILGHYRFLNNCEGCEQVQVFWQNVLNSLHYSDYGGGSSKGYCFLRFDENKN